MLCGRQENLWRPHFWGHRRFHLRCTHGMCSHVNAERISWIYWNGSIKLNWSRTRVSYILLLILAISKCILMRRAEWSVTVIYAVSRTNEKPIDNELCRKKKLYAWHYETVPIVDGPSMEWFCPHFMAHKIYISAWCWSETIANSHSLVSKQEWFGGFWFTKTLTKNNEECLFWYFIVFVVW